MAPNKAKEPLMECLIREMRPRQCIWNKTSKDYKNSFLKSSSWMEILSSLKSRFSYEDLILNKMHTVDGLKNTWRNTRDTYSRKKREAGKQGAGAEPEDALARKEWALYNSLKFLDRNYDASGYDDSIVDDDEANQESADVNSLVMNRQASDVRIQRPPAQVFRLRWNDFESNVMSSFRQLRNDQDFFDVSFTTADSGGRVIQAHKVILASCSNYFKQLLRHQHRTNPNANQLIFLKGVAYNDLVSVLDFMYNGEVKLAQCHIKAFLSLAEELQIKGLNNQKASSILAATLKRSLPGKRNSAPTPAKMMRKTNLNQSISTTTPEEEEESNIEEADENSRPDCNSQIVKIDPSEVLEHQQQQDEGEEVEDEEEEYFYDEIEEDLQEGEEEQVEEDPEDSVHDGGSTFNPHDYIKTLSNEASKAECTLCKFKFKSAQNCKIHIIRTHGPPQYFECKFCSKVIKSSYNFRDHVMKMHGVSGKQLVETYGKIVD